jgi:hypothetical protein
VHGAAVEGVLAVAHAQEARALLEGLRAEAGHVEQPLREREGAVASRCETMRFARVGPMPATRESSGALAVLSSTPTEFTQLSTTSSSFLARGAPEDVVLVLPHADGLGVDLHQLGERVLQAARDGDGPAHREVEVGELLAGDV